MNIYTSNEWDPLKKVIVGIADFAKIPAIDKSVRCINYADRTDISNIKPGLYPQQIIDESNEDLETFVNFLKSENVEVVRPDSSEDVQYYNYCPRDTVFIHKNKILSTPMSIRPRYNEFTHLLSHIPSVEVAPRYHEDDLYDENCINNPEKLALSEVAPSFDAANAIRANDDILYLVSNSGNQKGAEYLQNWINSVNYENTKIHILKDVYSYMHIDSTIAFLREGLLLANPSRIKNREVLPKPFSDWDIVWAPEPVDVGHYPNICNSSVWTWNVNLFSINPNLVVLEEHQTPTRKELEKYGIECAMLPLRHARTLGGCFHCCTLDLIRQS